MKNNETDKKDMESYIRKKPDFSLCELLKIYNDGRMKNYYCIAVNLFPMAELETTMKNIRNIENNKNIEKKEKAKMAKNIFTEAANNLGIGIRLRK